MPDVDVTPTHDTHVLAGVKPAPAAQDEKLYTASQWQLMWWRFKQHKLALISTVIVILFYIVALFCEFFAMRCLALELLANLISRILKKKLSTHTMSSNSTMTAMKDAIGRWSLGVMAASPMMNTTKKASATRVTV